MQVLNHSEREDFDLLEKGNRSVIFCTNDSVGIEVFDRGELEDCDLLEQGNWNIIFSMNNNVRLEVGLLCKSVYCN